MTPRLNFDEATLGHYYAFWHVSAIHTLLMSKTFSAEQLSARLMISVRLVEDSLKKLLESGLVTEQRGAYRATPRRLHLPPDSSWVMRHHLNWREQVCHSMERKSHSNDLHYSGPMVMSQESAAKLHAMLVQMLEQIEPLMSAPGEEEALAVCIDLFSL